MSTFLNLQQMGESFDSEASASQSKLDEEKSHSREGNKSSKGSSNKNEHVSNADNAEEKRIKENNPFIFNYPCLLSSDNFFNDKEKFKELVKYLFTKVLNETSSEQKFDEIIERCKEKPFIDFEFPPNENSLIKGYNSYKIPLSLKNDLIKNKSELQKNWKNVKWKRQTDFLNYKAIFPNEITSADIKINKFSNSNFVSAISALAEYPKIIKRLFLSNKVNSCGAYRVLLSKDGLMQEIVVDDYLPVDENNNLLFSEDKKKSLWVPILEKCYAKAYGSYNLIESKEVEVILRDLTLAPVETLDNLNDDLIKELEEAFKRNWIILASAGDTEASQELLMEIGLKPDCHYTILLVHSLSNALPNEVNDDNYITVLKIRNLWSKIDWIGEWSDNSTYWNDELKESLQYVENDNSFHMNLKDFKHYFSKIKICKYMDNYVYNSILISQKAEDYTLAEIIINDVSNEKGTHCFISFVQAGQLSPSNESVYGISRLILCMIKDDEKENEIMYIEGKMGQEREIIIETLLEPGRYLLFCELSKIEEDSKYVVSVYSSNEVILTQLNKKYYPNILEKIYISCAKIQNYVSKFEQEGAPNCYKYSMSTPEGYTYIYFENNEEDATLIEDVKYTKFEGLKLLSPFSGTRYKVEIRPGEKQIILIKHLELNEYNLIFSYQSSIKFGQKTLIKLAKEQGLKKTRRDKKKNVDLDINVYIYKHSFGLCYYYENNTTNKRLKETLNIANNTNVDFVGEKEGKNEVLISLEPKQTFFIELRGKNNLWKVQPMVSYAIETVGEQEKNT